MNLDWTKFDPELPRHFNALLGPSRARQKLSFEKPPDFNKIVKVSIVMYSCCLILNDKIIADDSCDMISGQADLNTTQRLKLQVLNLVQSLF